MNSGSRRGRNRRRSRISPVGRANKSGMINRLSVVLATFNEEENIGRCLESVKQLADEMIVVDGSSMDKTRELAEQMGAKVYKTTNKPVFHINKQMAMDKAEGNWVLQLDADEVVDSEMKQAIKRVIDDDGTINAYWLKRKNFFLGRFLTKGGQYPDPVIRLYRNGKARLPQKSVHEQMEVDGEVGWLDGHLMHYNSPTFSRYITNANRYTSLTATKMRKEGVKMSLRNDLSYLVVKPVATFFAIFFRHKGFRDGFPGFVFAWFSGLHHALAYMKLGDLYRSEMK